MSDLVLDVPLRSNGSLKTKQTGNTASASSASLSEKRALVPVLWFYEVGNGLLMAYRRKRIALEQIDAFLTRLKALPIDAAHQTPAEILQLPALAHSRGLTNYDAAYLALASRFNLPLATTDSGLRKAATLAGVGILTV